MAGVALRQGNVPDLDILVAPAVCNWHQSASGSRNGFGRRCIDLSVQRRAARVGRTEELDAANLGENLLGEDLIGGGGHFDFAFRHFCGCRRTGKLKVGDELKFGVEDDDSPGL
jgi:hypothetical protein